MERVRWNASVPLWALLAGLAGCTSTSSPPPDSPATPAAVAEITVAISGMVCGGCESAIQERVGALEGVLEVKASHRDGKAWIRYDPRSTSPQAFVDTIVDLGYTATLPP